MSVTGLKTAVRQPLTWSGVPRSEGGTVTGAPGTALYSDPIYVGDSEALSVEFAVSNVSGTTHALVKHQSSFNYNPKADTGDWVDETTVVADNTTNDTPLPFALTLVLAPYIRFEFSGAASNGAYNRIRGSLIKQ